MSYYGDVLDGTDKRMDLDFEEPFKHNAPKQLALKFKGKGLSVGQDFVDGKFKTKNELTLNKLCNDEHSGKLTATNKDFTYEHTWTPESLNKDGVKSTLVAEGKWMPSTDNWEGKAEYKHGGLDLGGAKAWTELQFDTNKKKEHKVTYSQNINKDDFHMGWKLVYGVNASKLTQADGFVAQKTADYDVYLRAAGLNRFVGVGLGWSNPDYGKMALEVQYDFLKKTKGLMGMPLFLRWGQNVKLANGMNYSVWYHGEKNLCSNKAEVPLGDNMKVTVSSAWNALALFQDRSKVNFKVGFAVEYKL